MARPLQIIQRLGVIAVVINDDDFVIPISRASQRLDTLAQHGDVVASRDDDGDARAVIGKFVREDAAAGFSRPRRQRHVGLRAAPVERLLHGAQPCIEAFGLGIA